MSTPVVPAPGIIEEIEAMDVSEGGAGWIVTVFNNEVNTWEEVVDILRRATYCTFEEAWNETWEIDNLGMSVVHHGDESECQRAADTIATIGIKVEVSKG